MIANEGETEFTYIETGDSAQVKLTPTKEMVCESFKDFPALGRFAIRDMKMTVAVGVVEKTTKDMSEDNKKK